MKMRIILNIIKHAIRDIYLTIMVRSYEDEWNCDGQIKWRYDEE